METLTMNMVQTTGFAIIVLLIGMLVRKKVRFFTKYCIPAPVIGGLIFSIVTTILRSANILEFDFDTTLQSFFQIMYFCTIGFAASFKMLKVGGLQGCQVPGDCLHFCAASGCAGGGACGHGRD